MGATCVLPSVASLTGRAVCTMALKDLCCLAKLLLIHLLLLDSHAFANGNSSFLAEPRRRRSSAPWRRERYATTLHSGLSNFFFG